MQRSRGINRAGNWSVDAYARWCLALFLENSVETRLAEVRGLGASIAVALHQYTLFAVVGIRHARVSTDNAFATVCAKVAFVANPHNFGRTDVRIAQRTVSRDAPVTIALFAQAPNRDAGHLAAQNHIWIMSVSSHALGHGGVIHVLHFLATLYVQLIAGARVRW